jgi:hypothetical protein
MARPETSATLEVGARTLKGANEIPHCSSIVNPPKSARNEYGMGSAMHYLTNVPARQKALKMALAAAILTSWIGNVIAQERQHLPTDQEPIRSGDPEPNGLAPSRADRWDYDRSGTRGREGLGADPAHPEGPGVTDR